MQLKKKGEIITVPGPFQEKEQVLPETDTSDVEKERVYAIPEQEREE